MGEKWDSITLTEIVINGIMLSISEAEVCLIMATKKKQKYFEIDEQKKVITLDMSVKPSAADEKFVGILIASGAYKVRQKSAEKAKQMKARAKELPTDKAILEALAKDEKNLAMYKAIKQVKDAKESYNGKNGFFAARSWYLKEVVGKK